MKRLFALLVALLAAIGAATVVFFWRKNHRQSWDSSLSFAKDTASSWGKSVADEAGKSADKITAVTDDVTSTASDMAAEVKGAASS